MIAIEQDEQNADSRWKQEKPILRERVWEDKPSPITHTNLVQRLFVVTV